MPNHVKVNEERCKGCGICILTCPTKSLRAADRLNAKGYHPAEMVPDNKCTGCALCARMCPDICIEVFKEIDEKKKEAAGK